MWRDSTGIKRCGVALTSATTPAPLQNLSPSWVVSLSVATSFHTTSVGGTVSRLYMCKSVVIMMSRCFAGIQLRKVEERRQKSAQKQQQHVPSGAGRLDVQAIMEAAFEMRRKALEENDSEEDDDADGRWSDNE